MMFIFQVVINLTKIFFFLYLLHSIIFIKLHDLFIVVKFPVPSSFCRFVVIVGSFELMRKLLNNLRRVVSIINLIEAWEKYLSKLSLLRRTDLGQGAPGAYSEPSRTSKMELFAKMINGSCSIRF